MTPTEEHIPACHRVPIENPAPGVYMAAGAMLPLGWIESLEQNQLIPHCCRHPENHDVEAFYTTPRDRDLGVPDVYVLSCPCGRQHRKFCVSPPETAGILVYCTRPDFSSRMVEALRPIWA